jgi:hypothetical protein
VITAAAVADASSFTLVARVSVTKPPATPTSTMLSSATATAISSMLNPA